MKTRGVLLACFMYSEYHLHSKISKQGVLIRYAKKVLAFYRDCCMHFTEVTGRAHSYFLVPICQLLWAERVNQKVPRSPFQPQRLSDSVAL